MNIVLTPPYSLGIRLHPRVAPNAWFLQTGNELGDSVRQKRLINGAWSTDIGAFRSAHIFPRLFLWKYAGKTRLFRFCIRIFRSREELFFSILILRKKKLKKCPRSRSTLTILLYLVLLLIPLLYNCKITVNTSGNPSHPGHQPVVVLRVSSGVLPCPRQRVPLGLLSIRSRTRKKKKNEDKHPGTPDTRNYCSGESTPPRYA